MQKAVFACLMLVVTVTSMAQELPPPFPRTNATKLFENDRINVWDIVWPRGQPTALHRHIYDQVGTYYQRVYFSHLAQLASKGGILPVQDAKEFLWKEFTGFFSPFDIRGSLGLYVDGGIAWFKNVAVTPLSDK